MSVWGGLNRTGSVGRPTAPEPAPSRVDFSRSPAASRSMAPPRGCRRIPGRSRPSRSPPPAPKAPPRAPLPTDPGDLFSLPSPGCPRSITPAGHRRLRSLLPPPARPSRFPAATHRCWRLTVHRRCGSVRWCATPPCRHAADTAPPLRGRHRRRVRPAPPLYGHLRPTQVHTATLLPYSSRSLHLPLTPVLTEWTNFCGVPIF